MSESVEGLTAEVSDGVLEVVIDRGHDNLFTMSMCDHLSRLLSDPPQGAHVLRLRAKGPTFCLGRERAGETVSDVRQETLSLIGLNTAIGASPLVTVAELAGDAAGYGVGLASLCDLVIAAPSARVWFPEVSIDLSPSVVLTWLPRLVGPKQAFILTATGERIDAKRAAELGLVTEVSHDDAGLEELTTRRIAALRRWSPKVHTQIATFLRSTSDMTEAQAYNLASERLITGSLERRRD